MMMMIDTARRASILSVIASGAPSRLGVYVDELLSKTTPSEYHAQEYPRTVHSGRFRVGYMLLIQKFLSSALGTWQS